MSPKQQHCRGVTMTTLRRQMRAELDRQLQHLLLGTTTAPDGTEVTVLDDIVMRSRAGYAIQVHLKVLKPEALQQAAEEARRMVERAQAEQAAREAEAQDSAPEPRPRIEVVPK